MPPNQCGVHFDGFYPDQFGEWEFLTSTMSKNSKGKTVSIETVEGPCEGIINSPTESDLKTPEGMMILQTILNFDYHLDLIDKVELSWNL